MVLPQRHRRSERAICPISLQNAAQAQYRCPESRSLPWPGVADRTSCWAQPRCKRARFEAAAFVEFAELRNRLLDHSPPPDRMRSETPVVAGSFRAAIRYGPVAGTCWERGYCIAITSKIRRKIVAK
jgi:hypothetical protein